MFQVQGSGKKHAALLSQKPAQLALNNYANEDSAKPMTKLHQGLTSTFSSAGNLAEFSWYIVLLVHQAEKISLLGLFPLFFNHF